MWDLDDAAVRWAVILQPGPGEYSDRKKMTMKIAFVINEFPCLSETFILNQITGMLDLGHDVEIFATSASSDSKTHPDVEKYHLLERTHYFPTTPGSKILRIITVLRLIASNLHKTPKILRYLKAYICGKRFLSLGWLHLFILLCDQSFEIINCHYGFIGRVVVAFKEAGLTGGICTVFHGADMSKYLLERGNDVYQNLIDEGDLFLPISGYWKNKLIEMGCHENKIIVHHMGIDLDKFEYAERRIEPGQPIKILTIGRLTEKKGHEYAIKAVAKLLPNHSNIEYLIAGDGPLIDKLTSLVMELALSEKVRFLGTLEQNEIIELYKQAHIFLLPSVTASDGDQEGIPVVLMEAAAVGLPILSSDHTGIPELVRNGQSGFTVPEKNVDALAEKLEYLIDHPQVWPEMGRSARNCVERDFNITTLNRTLEQIFQNMPDRAKKY